MTWTILLITYNVLGIDLQTQIVFPNQKKCGEAMSQIYAPINAEYRRSMAQCVATTTLSSSPIPKPRPQKVQ